MSYLKSYFRYVKNAGDDTKNLHSIFIAGILTGVFIVIYLYTVRGIAPPSPDLSGEVVHIRAETNLSPMDRVLQDNQKVVTETNSFEPLSAIQDAIKKASEDISNIKKEISGASTSSQPIAEQSMGSASE